MNYAVVVTKVDPQVKKDAQKIAEKMGLSLTSVINRYLKHFITTKTITFSAQDEIPNEYLIKTIKQAEKDWKAGKGSPIFKTGEEAVAWLEKQGL